MPEYRLIDPPSGVLDKDKPWYTAKVGAGTWNLLKLKLTGNRDSHGGSYSSTVNLSDADADRLIANMKEDPRGYPQMDDGGGGMGWYNNYGRFQAWLVEQYLGKKVEEEEEDGMVDEPEPPKASISLYEGIKETDNVEEVDENIVSILGLDDVSDFNYGEYTTLLKEKLIQSRIDSGSVSSEEDTALREEFSRVKGKVGKFKLKKRKITAENFNAGSGINGVISSASSTLSLSKVESEGSYGAVENIHDKLDDILESLREQADISKEALDAANLEKKKEGRKDQEEDLEAKRRKKIITAFKKIKPAFSLFDQIFKFIKNVFLAKVVYTLIGWFQDPKNKAAVDTIIRFLSDFWPAIVGGWILFGTKFGAFARGLIKGLVKLTRLFSKKVMPRLLRAARRNPKAAALMLAGTAILGGGLTLMGQSQESSGGALDSAENKKGSPLTKGEKTKAVTNNLTQQGGMFPGIGPAGSSVIQQQTKSKSKSDGGKIFGFIQEPEPGELTSFNGGGEVSGTKGEDKIPSMLSDGEFVVSKGGVEYIGLDNLLNWNAEGGGTNQPSVVNQTLYATTGGPVGETESQKKPSELDQVMSGGHDVISKMGMRNLKISPGMHMGVDITANIGEKLLALEDGIVEGADYEAGYGNWVNVTGKNSGLSNFYAHMNRPAFKKVGSTVKKGDVVGESGNSGSKTTGPHLHWEMSTNPNDTGRSKSNVLSRLNPLSRFGKEEPFGGMGSSLTGGSGRGAGRAAFNSGNRTPSSSSSSSSPSSGINMKHMRKMVIGMINDKEKYQLKWAKRNRREIENGPNAMDKALLARADRLDPDNNILISASETKALTSGTNDPTSMFYKPRSILERTNWADSEQFGTAMLKLGGLPTGPTVEEKIAAHWENVGVGSAKGAMSAVIRSNQQAMLNPPQHPLTPMGIPDITVNRSPYNSYGSGFFQPSPGTQVPSFPVGLSLDMNKVQTLGVSP